MKKHRHQLLIHIRWDSLKDIQAAVSGFKVSRVLSVSEGTFKGTVGEKQQWHEGMRTKKAQGKRGSFFHSCSHPSVFAKQGWKTLRQVVGRSSALKDDSDPKEGRAQMMGDSSISTKGSPKSPEGGTRRCHRTRRKICCPAWTLACNVNALFPERKKNTNHLSQSGWVRFVLK